MHVDFRSRYPAVLMSASPPAQRTCSCGRAIVVREQVPIGLMDDGEGGTLLLYNCPTCRTTLSEEVTP